VPPLKLDHESTQYGPQQNQSLRHSAESINEFGRRIKSERESHECDSRSLVEAELIHCSTTVPDRCKRDGGWKLSLLDTHTLLQ
jgi:hypothetical protein